MLKMLHTGFQKMYIAYSFILKFIIQLREKKILENFLTNISSLEQTWTPDSFIDSTITELREKIGGDKVILGLSGGVDSSVAAILLHKAIGKNLHCIFVNNGLLRKNEFYEVLDQYKEMDLNISGVDYSEEFYNELKGVSDPEMKRKIIGRVFIEAFEKESNKIKNVNWLGQGTIYPDVIESISGGFSIGIPTGMSLASLASVC